jgi:chromosome segregation ATPase
MSDTFITIHTGCQQGDESVLQSINTKLELIMASLQQLSAEVGTLREQVIDLKAAIDTEQQQVADALNTLNTTIQQLQQLVTDGGTAEQRQAILDQAIEVRTMLQEAKADISSTIADTPIPNPGNGDIGTSGTATPPTPGNEV